MFEINRAVLIVKPKQPFLEWTIAVDPTCVKFTLENLRKDCHSYLVPQIWFEPDKDKLLEEFYAPVFEDQLMGWHTVPEDWPKDRNLKMFREWFDVEFHGMVFDLLDEPIEDVDDEDEEKDETPENN